MAGKKIGELTPLGRNLIATDELELSLAGSAGSRKITGAQIIGAAGGVTSVTGTAPIISSGGTTPEISIATANTSTTGALTSTDWNTFNDKQNALVSGTNIKTINGASVLGSGDLVVSSSKAGGLYALLPPISGSVVCNRLFGSAFGSQTYGNNIISLMPFIPANTFTCSDISLIVSVNGTGTPQGRILIYSNGTTGAYINRPYNKLFESANLDFSTTGAKTALLSMTFTAGETYWIGFQNSFTTTSAAISSIGTASLAYIIPVAATASINSVVTNSSFTFGSAPATMTTGATATNANVAYMLFTIA